MENTDQGAVDVGPAVPATIKDPATLTQAEAGFSAATPYEIAQRFAAGELGREDLVEQLARWEYVPEARTDGYDSLIVDPPGTFEEVTKARRHELIDGKTYDAILDRMKELQP